MSEVTCQKCNTVLEGDEMVGYGTWGLCDKCADNVIDITKRIDEDQRSLERENLHKKAFPPHIRKIFDEVWDSVQELNRIKKKNFKLKLVKKPKKDE